MLVYFDEDESIRFTLLGDVAPPPGNHIEAPDQDLDPLAIWRVRDGGLSLRPDWEAILLAERRAGASLTRVELAVRLAWPAVGILSSAEAAQFARGDTPASLQPYIDALDGESMIRFCGATQFDRLDPTLIALAAEMHVPEVMMDVVFGVIEPPAPPDPEPPEEAP